MNAARMRRVPTRAALLITLLATALVIVLGSGDRASATPSATLVINEVYGGGGNSGATYTNDFIELANRSSSSVPRTASPSSM